MQLQNGALPGFGEKFNPLLRCIVRRTRGYLESTINPATGGYFLPKVAVRLFGEDSADALALGGYLRDAYVEAEEFCRLLQQRVKGAGFFKTLLLRRLGSSMEAGRNTVAKLLGAAPDEPSDEDEDDVDDDNGHGTDRGGHRVPSDFKDFTRDEIASLKRCLDLLKQGAAAIQSSKRCSVIFSAERIAGGERWIDRGCILFSQYYDTVRWVGDELAKRPELEGVEIGLYAGAGVPAYGRGPLSANRARIAEGARALRRSEVAARHRRGVRRAQSPAPRNVDQHRFALDPTRLEQRKGRIQRIGQIRSEVWIANLRYRGSVEDRVHHVLAERLEAIHQVFGQIPDTLEDVWVRIALEGEQEARRLIDRTTATRSPFDAKYSKVEDADWETCELVLDPLAVKEQLSKGW